MTRTALTRLILWRALSLLLTLLVVSAIIFLLTEILPGDPASILLGTSARGDTLEALRRELGLDLSAWERYARWLVGMLQGDFGTSLTYRVPVSSLIAERLNVTLPLSLLAIILSTALAFPLGVIAAANRNRLVDRVILAGAQIGTAIPNFWIGILFILFFATWLGWFPAGGFPGWSAGFLPALCALVLPAFALALPQAAVLARVMRGATLDVIEADFVRTARAKGLSRSQTLWRHVTPNALIPVATILGLQLSFFFGGAVLVENVFNLPGLGRLAYQALSQRDFIVIRDVVLLFAGIVIVVNFAVDLCYLLLDPRLRGGNRG